MDLMCRQGSRWGWKELLHRSLCHCFVLGDSLVVSCCSNNNAEPPISQGFEVDCRSSRGASANSLVDCGMWTDVIDVIDVDFVGCSMSDRIPYSLVTGIRLDCTHCHHHPSSPPHFITDERFKPSHLQGATDTTPRKASTQDIDIKRLQRMRGTTNEQH